MNFVLLACFNSNSERKVLSLYHVMYHLMLISQLYFVSILPRYSDAVQG